jgi:hypothetical protein
MPLGASLQPFSGKSVAIAPYILSGSPTQSPEISISYPDSKVTSFDTKSLAFACAAAAQQGLVVAAIDCKILFTGTKVSGDTVTFDATVVPSAPSSVRRVYKKLRVAFRTFDSDNDLRDEQFPESTFLNVQ